ncbi:uncharacterized protein F4807DRAFT_446756 [Annulohypoxylon truncatum]|uniref:uncharacterized protein n=1 Tax=Annulohypoxylon truncatum TaxID=327061 RepID=UPI002007E16C|nr:uncharacterized protein F4807DRAFT_446756 [Annulohypoxylon truncatum]KAI1204540.1 hypothetical protein F4807DRAFT_446756 [Annulohypoxylon truncatum]
MLDQQTLIYVRSHNGILQNMRASLVRMMAFYGFDVSWDQDDDFRFKLSFVRDNPELVGRWLKEADQNHTHIKGIIWSLRLFGLSEEAQRVYEAFIFANETYGSPVGEASLDQWRQAFVLPLCIISYGFLNFQPRFYSLKLNDGSLTPQRPQNPQN